MRNEGRFSSLYSRLFLFFVIIGALANMLMHAGQNGAASGFRKYWLTMLLYFSSLYSIGLEAMPITTHYDSAKEREDAEGHHGTRHREYHLTI